jgi:hypothetical protein
VRRARVGDGVAAQRERSEAVIVTQRVREVRGAGVAEAAVVERERAEGLVVRRMRKTSKDLLRVSKFIVSGFPQSKNPR